jgi:hypothetical protein
MKPGSSDQSPADAARDPRVNTRMPRILAALEEQLDLRLLKAKDVPLDVLVIGHARLNVKDPTF